MNGAIPSTAALDVCEAKASNAIAQNVRNRVTDPLSPKPGDIERARDDRVSMTLPGRCLDQNFYPPIGIVEWVILYFEPAIGKS